MNETLFDLSGKSAFVTGAASGLGFAMSEAMIDAGAALTLADVDGDALERAVAHFRTRSNSVEGVVLDVREPDSVKGAVRHAAAKGGGLDIVFANAGITGGPPHTTPEGQIEKVDLAVWDNVLKVNLTGVFATMQAAAEVMKPRRKGRIIATASISGMRTSNVSGYAYSATKAAVIHLVHLAAVELAPYNIMVNGIAPGPFMTNIAGGKMFTEPERVKMMASTVPLGRVAQPSELKGLALLLASDASSFLTGQVIPIDGGSTAQ